MCPTSDALREGWRTSSRHDGYEVHYDGRVRNARTLRELKPQQAKGGRYAKLHLGSMQVQLHQLVCETWHGPKPPGMPRVVDHIDNDGQRNCATNVRWLSYSCNTRQWYAIQARFEREGIAYGWDLGPAAEEDEWAATAQRLARAGL